MPTWQVSSPTKLTKISAPALGRGGAASCCWVPRPPSYGAAFEPEVPRSWTGINEYLYALSLRHPAAVRCATASHPAGHRPRARPPVELTPRRAPHANGRAAGRLGAHRWELEPEAAGLRTLRVKLHQQYESPAAVMQFVRHVWQPDFDAMATPFSAICSAYATLEDDVMLSESVPRDSIVYVNPAYAPEAASNGAAGIERVLQKLIEVDVRTRGCTVVALLPNLHAPWHQRFVSCSHEVHHIVSAGSLVFQNPARNLTVQKKGYLWEGRAYILAVWRPTPPPPQPAWLYAHLQPGPSASAERISLRSCRLCGSVRVLPRWADSTAKKLQPGTFRCADNPDQAYAACDAPEFLPVFFS